MAGCGSIGSARSGIARRLEGQPNAAVVGAPSSQLLANACIATSRVASYPWVDLLVTVPWRDWSRHDRREQAPRAPVIALPAEIAGAFDRSVFNCTKRARFGITLALDHTTVRRQRPVVPNHLRGLAVPRRLQRTRTPSSLWFSSRPRFAGRCKATVR